MNNKRNVIMHNDIVHIQYKNQYQNKNKNYLSLNLLDKNKIICYIMRNGKKRLAYNIWLNTLNLLSFKKAHYNSIEKIDESIKKILLSALKNVIPNMIKSKNSRYGFKKISKEKGINIGFRWLINTARKRGERTMSERLFKEILEASEGKGNTVKKKESFYNSRY